MTAISGILVVFAQIVGLVFAIWLLAWIGFRLAVLCGWMKE